MKNKIIALLILTTLILPSFSDALIIVPTANVTIIVNTQGQDNSFNFNITDGQQFAINTVSLTGSRGTSVLAFPGTHYFLTQQNVPGLKIGGINCVSDNPAGVFSYTPDSAIFSPKSGENITCIFNNVKAKNPVLIVPGLMGTEMKEGDELLWANLGTMLTDIGDNFMDPLAFNQSLTPIEPSTSILDVIGKKTLGPFTSDYTSGLITEFKNKGYLEGESLFIFPYDWRYGVSGQYADGKTNVDLLAQKIQEILTQTGSDKVDVVAHSQGGLIVKKYVVDHAASHHIGKAVFVGVPNTGAPKATKVFLQGDNFGIPWLSEAEIKKISENMPAAYDLLPSQKYYDVKGSFLKVIDQGELLNLFDTTEKDLNYSEFGNFITNDHSLNSTALAQAQNLHTVAFDNFDMRTAGVDLYAIDGCKTGTIGTIIENRQKSIFAQTLIDYKNPTFTPGDGTVPLESSTNLPIDQSHAFYSLTGEHSKLMSQDGSRQEIVNLLAGSNLEVKPDLITQDISKCNLNGKAISVFSPVDVFVTDQHGNHLGIAEDGSIVNEIPNAAFEVFGSSSFAEASKDKHAFLYLPTDEGQVYDVKMQGIGTGTYTIHSKDIVDSQTVGTEVFSNLPVTAALTGQINLGAQTTLTVQETPESNEQIIVPSAVLDGAKSEDFAPPIVTAILQGTAGQPGFYKTDVTVNINATDDNSGVLNISYNLDGAGYQKVFLNSVALPVLSEGLHTVSFFSTDNAGNNGPEQTVNFTIDKTAPEALVQFDIVTMDLKFSAQNDANVVVTDKDDTITLTDQAGNVTEIKLKDKDRKKSMAAQIKSLKYNGVVADISKNIMQYNWKYDKTKNLKELSQHVKSRKEYNINADFDGKNTKLEGKDGKGKISKSFTGLKILKITTNKGDFDWSY